MSSRLISEPYTHKLGKVRPDGQETVTFHWHWPRGTFEPRMSALEIAAFVLPHMAAIIGMGLLAHHPQIEGEFRAMLVRLVTWPTEVLDELAAWIKPVVKTADDDLIVMELFARKPQPVGPIYSCPS